MAVSEACGSADNLVQDNSVHYADPSMRVSRLNLARTDYLGQAEELAPFFAVDRAGALQLLPCSAVNRWSATS